MYELIVFDWDGTLMDSTALIAGSLQSACRDVGAPVPSDADARYVIGLNLADILRHVAPDIDPEVQARLIERYRYHFTAGEQSPLFEGIADLLAELHGSGKRLAVATGKSRRGLQLALDRTGLGRLFEFTRCADEGFAKPHPGMLHAILDYTGVEASRAVMVGDTTHDLQLAANAGVDAIAVLYGAHHPELLDTHGAIARCATVAELRQCLIAA